VAPAVRPAPADSEPVAVARPVPVAVRAVEEVASAPVAAARVAASALAVRAVVHPAAALAALSPAAAGPVRTSGPAGRRSAGAARS
jgi:hypothetical protein